MQKYIEGSFDSLRQIEALKKMIEKQEKTVKEGNFVIFILYFGAACFATMITLLIVFKLFGMW